MTNLRFQNMGFVAQFRGLITLYDIYKINKEIYGHPEFANHLFQIFDLSEAKIKPDEEASQILSEHAAIDLASSYTNKNVKVATIATDPEIIKLITIYEEESRKFESPWEFATFDNFDDAMNWIGIKKI